MGGQSERAARILGLRQTFHPEGRNFRINTYQDVEPHLEHAARVRREMRESGPNRKSVFRPRMSVPFNVMQQVAQKLGIPPKDVFEPEQNKRIWKALNSSDYKNFRLREGKRI